MGHLAKLLSIVIEGFGEDKDLANFKKTLISGMAVTNELTNKVKPEMHSPTPKPKASKATAATAANASKTKSKSEKTVADSCQSQPRPQPPKWNLDWENPPKLDQWFAQTDVASVDEELDRVRQHKWFQEFQEYTAWSGKTEWVWESEPYEDLRLWLQFWQEKKVPPPLEDMVATAVIVGIVLRSHTFRPVQCLINSESNPIQETSNSSSNSEQLHLVLVLAKMFEDT